MANDVLIPTIFHEDWWLDAATHGEYRVVEVVNAAGKKAGRLPYHLTRRMGLKRIGMPTLTHFYGPAIDEGPGNIQTRFSTRLEITRELINKLPAADFLQIRCHRGVKDVIPFMEQKFRTTAQFTYEVHPAPRETLWANLRNEKRRIITKSLENGEVVTIDDPAVFLKFYESNLQARGAENELDFAACSRILTACLERQCGRISAIKDKAGNYQAAIFCPWDSEVKYYLMATRSQTAARGDVSALIWDAIHDASNRNLIFDLDGIANPGTIIFYSDFGGIVEPRFVATRMSMPLQLLQTLMRSSSKAHWFI